MNIKKDGKDDIRMNKEILSVKAPAAVGPYSAGIEAVGTRTVYVSGQLPVNPATGQFAGDDIEVQTKQSIENIRAILEEAGMDLRDVVKTTVYLTDIADFGRMNEVYGSYFQQPYPARCAFQVVALPKGALIEIDAVAEK